MRDAIEKADVLSLPGAEREVREAGKIVGGGSVILTGEDATETQLKKLGPGSRIIHLAAHARVDDNAPWSSYIQLAGGENSGDDGKVEAFELMKMQLDAELVVLSGCNTGASLQAGPSRNLVEGLIGGGVPAVVATLWSADDELAPEFMRRFYAYLSQGERKSRAIQLAKLDFIKSGKRDPYYWAGYILIGDASPISTDVSSSDPGLQNQAALLVISALMITTGISVGLWRLRVVQRRKGNASEANA